MTTTKQFPTLRFLSVLLLLVLSTGMPSLWAALPTTPEGEPLPTLAPMIQKVSPAVVNISIRGTIEARNPGEEEFRRFFGLPDRGGNRQQFNSAGSGVIVDAENGYIITNAHVVERADEITIVLQDDRQLEAEVIGTDPDSDIAVLKTAEDGLTQIALGDSDRALVGDFVVAIGNPFGLQHTVTSGIVSGLGRSNINSQNPNAYEDFIQTDASINPGNSGGALVNLRGELIGINSAILSRSGGNIGIGFAIPVNMVRSVMAQLIEHGKVRRGLLGVRIQDVNRDIAEAAGSKGVTGAFVSEVDAGSAAEAAGIEAGDIITSVNGEPTTSASELRNTIGLLDADEKVKVNLVRKGEKKTVVAALRPRQVPQQISGDELHRGLEGASLADITATRTGDSGATKGVIVTDVTQGSQASLRGLRTQDVITEVNGSEVSNVSELREAVEDEKSLLLRIRRGRGTVMIPIQ